MPIDRDHIAGLAELARIELTGSEVDALTDSCRKILEYFETVSALETSAAGDAVSQGAAQLRPDAPSADAILAPLNSLAPVWRGGFFLVPRLPGHSGPGE